MRDYLLSNGISISSIDQIIHIQDNHYVDSFAVFVIIIILICKTWQATDNDHHLPVLWYNVFFHWKALTQSLNFFASTVTAFIRSHDNIRNRPVFNKQRIAASWSGG